MKGHPILLDTNIVSYIMLKSSLGRRYESLIAGWDPHVSLVTVGELLYGAYLRRWSSDRVLGLREFIGRFEVFALTPEMADLASAYVWERRACGRPLEWNDAWIAATAVACHCPLVTHDSDFADLEGLYIISDLRALRTSAACVIYGTSQVRWLDPAA